MQNESPHGDVVGRSLRSDMTLLAAMIGTSAQGRHRGLGVRQQELWGVFFTFLAVVEESFVRSLGGKFCPMIICVAVCSSCSAEEQSSRLFVESAAQICPVGNKCSRLETTPKFWFTVDTSSQHMVSSSAPCWAGGFTTTDGLGRYRLAATVCLPRTWLAMYYISS